MRTARNASRVIGTPSVISLEENADQSCRQTGTPSDESRKSSSRVRLPAA